MPGKRDPKALPGRGKVRDGGEHLDARHGDYTRAQLEHMDAAFRRAVIASLDDADGHPGPITTRE
jgi:hypothetical protein